MNDIKCYGAKHVLPNRVSIHAFIFNWKDKTENALKLEELFNKIFDKVTVINSSEDYTSPHWVNLGDNAYFGDQFSKALEIFDCNSYDLLFHIQADVYNPENDWGSIIDSARHYYLKHNYAVYAPNIDYTFWSNEITKLNNFDGVYDPNIAVVTTTDCSCWFINSTIITNFKNKYLNAFKKNNLGWGACSVICGEGFMNRMPVLRDNNFKLSHPRGTSYNSKDATIQMEEFVSHIKDENILYFLKHMRNVKEMNNFIFTEFYN
jgi:hypothetical protein